MAPQKLCQKKTDTISDEPLEIKIYTNFTFAKCPFHSDLLYAKYVSAFNEVTSYERVRSHCL